MLKGSFISVILISFLCSLNAAGQDWHQMLDESQNLFDSLKYDSAVKTGLRAMELAEKEAGPNATALAEISIALGQYYYDLGKFSTAAEHFRHALDIYSNRDYEDKQLVAALDWLGKTNTQLGRYSDAERYLNRAGATAERLSRARDSLSARIYLSLADLEHSRGEYLKAESLFTRADDLFEKQNRPPDDLDRAFLNYRLCHLYFSAGKYSLAEDHGFKALEIYKKRLGENHPKVALCLRCVGEIYSFQERFRDAEPLINRAGEIIKNAIGNDNIFSADVLVASSLIDRFHAKSTEGIEKCNAALTIYMREFGKWHRTTARCMVYLGILHSIIGNLPEAEDYFREAINILEVACSPDHPTIGYCLYYLEFILYAQDKLEEAESIIKRALDIWGKRADSNHVMMARTLTLLGNLYSDRNQDDKAVEVYTKALEMIEKKHDRNSTDAGRIIEKLAGIHMANGNYDTAEVFLKKSFAIQEEIYGANHPFLARTMSTLGRLYMLKENYEEAEHCAQQAIDIMSKVTERFHLLTAMALEILCEIRIRQNRIPEAFEYAHEAYNIASHIFETVVSFMSEIDALEYSYIFSQYRDALLSTYAELSEPDDSLIQKAASAVLISKGKVSDQIFERQRIIFEDKDTLVAIIADSLHAVKSQLSDFYIRESALENAAYADIIDSLGKIANQLETQLSRRSLDFRRQKDRQDVHVDRISSLVPENAAVVEYLKYYQLPLHDSLVGKSTNVYLALVLKKDCRPEIINLGSAATIDSLVSLYQQHMWRISTYTVETVAPNLAEFRQLSHNLMAKIWKPLEPFIENQPVVLIAPDGELNNVSFAGLTELSGPYLVEKYAIHYLAAARDLIRYQHEPESGVGLLAIGDPDYDAPIHARLQKSNLLETAQKPPNKFAVRNIRSQCREFDDLFLTPLPGARAEIEAVASVWNENFHEPVTIRLGMEATEDGFKAEAPESRVIHLATHGYFFRDDCRDKNSPSMSPGTTQNPLLYSGLFFSGANLRGKGADSMKIDDGILTAYEVSAMNLKSVDMVVLSACETGMGKIWSGEDSYGLRRAFLMAGANTVISTLWPVSDRISTGIFTDLYSLKSETLPETMQKIQIGLINNLRVNDKIDHPAYWSAFISTGNWR